MLYLRVGKFADIRELPANLKNFVLLLSLLLLLLLWLWLLPMFFASMCQPGNAFAPGNPQHTLIIYINILYYYTKLLNVLKTYKLGTGDPV